MKGEMERWGTETKPLSSFQKEKQTTRKYSTEGSFLLCTWKPKDKTQFPKTGQIRTTQGGAECNTILSNLKSGKTASDKTEF